MNFDDIQLLFAAVIAGDIKLTQELIDKGVDVNKAVQSLPIDAITAYREELQTLINTQTTLTADLSSNQKNILKLKIIINTSYIINMAVKEGYSLLHLAAFYGKANIIKSLIAAGADVTLTSPCGNTPLHFAAAEGHVKIIEELLAAPRNNINALNIEKLTPIHFACIEGRIEAVKCLLKAGCEIDPVSIYKYTPFLLAADEGQKEIMLMLKKAGCDVHKTEEEGKSGLKLVIERGDPELIEFVNSLIKVDQVGRPITADTGASTGLAIITVNDVMIATTHIIVPKTMPETSSSEIGADVSKTEIMGEDVTNCSCLIC